MEIGKFLEAIPTAAQSLYGVIVFLATLGVWALLYFRVVRHKRLMQRINALPPGDRRDIVQTEMGSPIPPKLSPEQWIRSQLHKYYFLGAMMFVVCVSFVSAIAYLMRAQGPELSIDSTAPGSRPSGLKLSVDNSKIMSGCDIANVPEGSNFDFQLKQGSEAEAGRDILHVAPKGVAGAPCPPLPPPEAMHKKLCDFFGADSPQCKLLYQNSAPTTSTRPAH